MDRRPELWEKLFTTLESVQRDHSRFCIDEKDMIFITVDTLNRDMSGCHSCGVSYEYFNLTGKIIASYLPDGAFPYDAEITQYYMYCKDNNPDNLIEFCPLFKGRIDGVKDFICDRFLSESDIMEVN